MSQSETRKRLLSGMQPTGTGALHLGNLEGALKTWVRLQDQYEMFCCVVDWHALTTRYHETSKIAPACREVAADYIAYGLDPKKCAIFIQSHVKEHAELHLLLSMITPLGWLERVPTFKEKRELMAEKVRATSRSPTDCSVIPVCRPRIFLFIARMWCLLAKTRRRISR